MNDMSQLDRKYFVDDQVYNCPFCNRNNVSYTLLGSAPFDWSMNKKCYTFIIKCSSCEKMSMHLSYKELRKVKPQPISPISSHSGRTIPYAKQYYDQFDSDFDLDTEIFYSVPTSFFTLDSRIPRIVRECVSEAEGCLKMNYLTGASACMRKAIYELCLLEEAEGEHYEDKIKSLKEKHSYADSDLFEILAHIQNMTSDKVHEQSWDKWDATNLKLIIETLKTVLHEIYVIPEKRRERTKSIQQLREKVKTKKD